MLSGSRNGQKSGPGAIVGIFGNATEPEALERLNEVGELRLVGRKGRMFHPKVYIFQRPKKSVAWIGSANFTEAGFGCNEETVFETEDVGSVMEWFNTRWEKCSRLKPTDISDYRKQRRGHTPPKDIHRLVRPQQPARPGKWIRLDSVERYRYSRHGPYKVNPHPTKIRFKGNDIDCEWMESGGAAWQKMFVCLADWLAQKGNLTKGACPVEIKGCRPFHCVDTDRHKLPKPIRISGGMWCAKPGKANWSVERAKQLLERFGIDPADIELRLSE